MAGCSAHLLWGVAVLYWPLLAPLPAVTILAHRMLWSLLLLLALLLVTHRLPELGKALRSRTQAPRLALCSLLLAVNWGFFLWGVNNGHVVEASLGYFITPLLNVLMGRFLLGERLSRAQALAILLAMTGVGWKIIVYGHIPWLALIVSVSFALYGFFQKTLHVGAAPGLQPSSSFLFPLPWAGLPGRIPMISARWRDTDFLSPCFWQEPRCSRPYLSSSSAMRRRGSLWPHSVFCNMSVPA